MEEKSDVSRVKKTKGSYLFRIEGYSGLSNVPSQSVESPEFTLCGFSWQLRIFPGGSLEAHEGYLSFYLASKNDKVARVSYKLSVINQIVGFENQSFASPSVRVFAAKGTQVDGWGRDKFMSTGELLDPENGFCVDDCVSFKVEITVYGELELIRNCMANNNDCHGATLDLCFQKLLHFPMLSDVSICVGEPVERIPVNKCILMARSPVF